MIMTGLSAKVSMNRSRVARAMRESASDGLGQAWHMPRQDYVDFVIIGALWRRIDRDGCAPAAAKHATKL